jgi:uroporphyrinogen decarboxylase
LNTRENSLRAIRHNNPDYVPVFDGTVWDAVQLGGNFRYESWTDHWGTVWQAEQYGMVPTDIIHPLADIAALDNYSWPDPWALTWTDDDQKHLEELKKKDILVGGSHVKFVCERLCCLMGMDNFMLSMYEEPDRLQVLIDGIVDYNRVCIRRLLDLGVEIIHVSEDLGTQQDLMISPEQFRKFLLPAYEACFDEVKQRGVMIDFHSCGAVEKIIPDLMAIGIDILNPVQVTANDRRWVKDLVRGKMAVLGGINSYIVHTGTPNEIRNEVKEAFDIWRHDGGWIAAPDQVLNGAPEENIRVFWEYCHELAGNGE